MLSAVLSALHRLRLSMVLDDSQNIPLSSCFQIVYVALW